jgi:protein-S-isoprenylcysteine O-methyltransferase Ste14
VSALVVPGSNSRQHVPAEPDGLAQLGGWLFQRRTWLPLPLILALLLLPSQNLPTFYFWIGLAVVLCAEGLRLESVRHIGAVSRTRSSRLGPLVSTGPFARVRNPLYVGNLLLWAGFAVSARLLWLAPIVLALLAFQYHAIVRWEERLLESRLGDRYRAYAREVPRWVPRADSMGRAGGDAPPFSWRETVFSERGTLLAIAAGYLLLWLKNRA